MKIAGIIWLHTVVEKLARKHGVCSDEVEQVFVNKPQFRFVEKGHRLGEEVYTAYGQTNGGRYLTVLFICKSDEALIVSARDMAKWERKRHERK